MNDIFPKKTLRKLKAYRPAVSESKDKDVIRLSVNEGALGSSPLATKAIEEWSTKKHIFHRYPDQIDETNNTVVIKVRTQSFEKTNL